MEESTTLNKEPPQDKTCNLGKSLGSLCLRVDLTALFLTVFRHILNRQRENCSLFGGLSAILLVRVGAEAEAVVIVIVVVEVVVDVVVDVG